MEMDAPPQRMVGQALSVHQVSQPQHRFANGRNVNPCRL